MSFEKIRYLSEVGFHVFCLIACLLLVEVKEHYQVIKNNNSQMKIVVQSLEIWCHRIEWNEMMWEKSNMTDAYHIIMSTFTSNQYLAHICRLVLKCLPCLLHAKIQFPVNLDYTNHHWFSSRRKLINDSCSFVSLFVL